MRLFLALTLFALSPVALAQSTFASAEMGGGTPGSVFRGMMGIGHVGPITPTLRFGLNVGERPPLEAGRARRDGHVELGISAIRLVRFTDKLGVAGGAGLALAFGFREDPTPSEFSVPGVEAGLTMPLDAQAVFQLSSSLSATVGGYWSVPLAKGSSENSSRLRQRVPGLSHGGLTAGLRVGSW